VALGADRQAVLGLVLRSGLTMAVVGVSVRRCPRLCDGPRGGGLLFGVSPHDPLTNAGLAALLLVLAVAAAYLPARRATMVNPLETLR
jgi:hypothetical protein